MPSFLTNFNPLLVTIVLATLAIGLPILFILSIRFLWDRNLNLGRSKELEKLIWQLHRIASAMEHQMNLSYPAVQPGTEDRGDLAYLARPAAQSKSAPQSASAPSATAPVAPVVQSPAESQSAAQQPATPQQPAEPDSLPPLAVGKPSPEAPRQSGVNSMFGF